MRWLSASSDLRVVGTLNVLSLPSATPACQSALPGIELSEPANFDGSTCVADDGWFFTGNAVSDCQSGASSAGTSLDLTPEFFNSTNVCSI